MAKIISLSKARKTRNRVKSRTQATDNSVKFGRTKVQKTLDKARADKASRDLDGHERDQ